MGMKLASLLRTAAFALLLAVLASSGVWGAEEERVSITLPASVSVEGSQLLLGEIAELSGPAELVEKLAQINAGAAPIPGSSRRLTRGHIEIRLRRAGVDLNLVDFQGAEAVQVFGAVAGQAQHAAVGQSGYPVFQVVVAARNLERGEILTLADLQLEEREIRSGQADPRSPEEFVGLRATRFVSAGSPLTELNVEVVPVVERGAQVTIVVRTPTLVVTAPGVARESGGIGDLITVENTLSRERVSAVVIDSQYVEVKMREAGTP